MKRFTLPILDSDGSIQSLNCEIDITLNAQLKWETEFLDNSKLEDVFDYTVRVGKIKNTNAAKIVSLLKAIYCYIEVDNIKNFSDFLRLFNLMKPQYLSELVKALTGAVETITNSPAAKNLQSRECNS